MNVITLKDLFWITREFQLSWKTIPELYPKSLCTSTPPTIWQHDLCWHSKALHTSLTCCHLGLPDTPCFHRKQHWTSSSPPLKIYTFYFSIIFSAGLGNKMQNSICGIKFILQVYWSNHDHLYTFCSYVSILLMSSYGNVYRTDDGSSLRHADLIVSTAVTLLYGYLAQWTFSDTAFTA